MNQPQPGPTSNPAQTYEEYFVPYQFRPWTEELLERAKPQPGERVLDLACGTGIVARMVAQRMNGQAQLAGLDLSPAMLEVARSAARREGAQVAWHEGSAAALPFPDGSYDLVLVQQGLQFFPDKAAAAGEMYRVLDVGGRAATSTWTEIANNPFFEVFAGVIQKHLGTPALHTPFSLGDQATLRPLFVNAGFDDVKIERVGRTVRFPSPDRFVDLGLAGASAAVPALQTMDAAERAALTEAVRVDMEVPLRQYTDDDELVFLLETHIVLARKAG
ncbi:MAG: class I SAM-dependent methyltransferase [Chloroflexota bacterium]|nr:class I SAM-dependent methyltransferase [Chloroflexota bacterium]